MKNFDNSQFVYIKRPSIYVHKEGEGSGSGGRMWTGRGWLAP